MHYSEMFAGGVSGFGTEGCQDASVASFTVNVDMNGGDGLLSQRILGRVLVVICVLLTTWSAAPSEPRHIQKDQGGNG